MCTPVPEGGELCLTACVVTEGNGTCGKSKLTHPSSKWANNRVIFALFEDDIIGYIPTASSASLHMRLSIVGPLRGPITTNANIPKLRINRERPSFAFQKAVNCTLKGGLLQCKRPPFANVLIIRWLSDG